MASLILVHSGSLGVSAGGLATELLVDQSFLLLSPGPGGLLV